MISSGGWTSSFGWTIGRSSCRNWYFTSSTSFWRGGRLRRSQINQGTWHQAWRPSEVRSASGRFSRKTRDCDGKTSAAGHRRYDPSRQFSRRKIAVERKRQRLSETDREAIKAKDGYRCACCGETFKSTELVLDHLIPFSLRGADEPSNLVAMSSQHNMRKWDRLIRDDVKFYRGEKIRQRIGVRFVEGAFSPVVNGKAALSSTCSLTRKWSRRAAELRRRAAEAGRLPGPMSRATKELTDGIVRSTESRG